MLSSSPLSLDMAKVDPKVGPNSCWDGVANAGDEEFENILRILDFPMESLEGDGFMGDWDISKLNNLGPIPSDVLDGAPTFTQTKSEIGPPVSLRRQVALVDAKAEPKQLPYRFEEAPSSCVLAQNKSTEVHEQGVFQSQSPVSVLENNGSASAGKILLINSRISKRTRSKRARPSGVNSWLLISPLFSSSSRNTYSAKKIREGRKKMCQMERAKKTVQDLAHNSFPALEPRNAAASQRQAVTKKCTHCEVTKTPQWREGPLGPKTLCNACGVRYRSGRLYPEYRPAASPTFVPSIHSNSHKKVIEMRTKGKREMEQPSVSPELEFIPVSGYFFDPIC